MPDAHVAIVGGGLSGLYAAALLEERGVNDYVLLEARHVFGGRVLSLPHASSPHPVNEASAAADRFDMGATWFWPTMHPELQRLTDKLGLVTLAQHEAGDMLVERSANIPSDRVDGYISAPSALRLAGGIGVLIDALLERLAAGTLLSDHQVMRMRQGNGHIEVEAKNAPGHAVIYRAAKVLLAVPPRLAINKIEFTPTLPHDLLKKWAACPTWMAPHAKYVAVFDRPFWREQGLSGEARSYVGPMVEIHDASGPGSGALFGFLGMPAQQRSQVPDSALRSLCRAQFARLFGKEAATPKMEFLKDWAADPYTAVAADYEAGAHHSLRVPNMSQEQPWARQLVGIASEWSPNFSGYLAGALEAAQLGVEALLADKAAFPLVQAPAAKIPEPETVYKEKRS